MSAWVTAVIPSLDGLGRLGLCLPALLEKGGADRIVVVDDGSSDGTCEQGPLRFPGVEFVSGSEPHGFSSAVNLGASMIGEGYMLLLNNDVVAGIDAVEAMRASLDGSPREVFAVMPGIIRPDGRDESLLGCCFSRGLAVVRERAGTVYPSGACSMYRMEAWRSLGGLDTIFSPIYWEDVDLGLRAASAGLRTLRLETARVQHEHAATTGHSPAMLRLRERNRFLVMDRHFSSPLQRLSTLALFPLHAAGAILRRRPEFLQGYSDFRRMKGRRGRAG